MTNALAQNIQTESTPAIDLLARATNTSSFEAQDSSSATFSNVMNNLSAKTQKAKDDFNKKANVSNTSSINKEALNNKKEVNTKTPQENKNTITNKTKEITQNSEETIEKENTQPIENKETKTTQQEETIQKKETETKDLSDINNSSLVDTSPVFSSKSEVEVVDENENDLELKTEEKQEIVEIPTQTSKIPVIVDETSTIENQDLKTKSQDTIQNIQNADENIIKIENVSSDLDNSNLNSNLNQNQDKALIEKQIEIPNDKFEIDTQELKTVSQNDLNIEENQTTEDKTFENITPESTQNSEVKTTKDEKVYEVLDELTTKDFEKINIKDKKATEEIVKILDNIENNLSDFELNEKTSEEIKTQIQNLVKEIENETITPEKLEQTIEFIADEIKLNDQKQIETQPKIQTNVVDLANKFEKPILNQSEFQNNISKEDVKEFENVDLKDFEIPKEKETATKKVDLNLKINQNVNLEEVEENLQKTLFTQEIMEEMMVEVDIQTISSQSGALSVSDEIARLAMNETGALNPITSVHGSITYDNLGQNGIIKNVASLMNTQSTKTNDTPIMEDILNQVSNKITQLKDSATQKLTMVLRPHDLGRLSIELTSNQQGLTTHIVAQNENVRAFIEKNIDSLRQQLTDAGVNVNNIQIKTAGSENSTNYEGNQNFNRENQENFNQQNDNKNNNQQNNQNSKQMQEALANLSNYDMHFAKDFSSILNKSLSYNLN